jgi:hypothetical protein
MVITAPSAASEAAVGIADSEAVCVDVASERQLDVWTCMGGTLTYFDEREGSATELRTVSVQVAPTVVSSTTDSGVGLTPSATVAAPMSTTDPDNYWCEAGASVCQNVGNDYNGKVKGNVIWGDTKGVRGEFDLILKTKLNGRQSQASAKIFRDSGASLKFTNLRIECQHHGNAFGCGSKFADNADGVVSVTNSWIGGLVHGNRLEQKGTYNDRLTGRVTPTGAPVLPLPNLNGPNFACPSGRSGCSFP